MDGRDKWVMWNNGLWFVALTTGVLCGCAGVLALVELDTALAAVEEANPDQPEVYEVLHYAPGVPNNNAGFLFAVISGVLVLMAFLAFLAMCNVPVIAVQLHMLASFTGRSFWWLVMGMIALGTAGGFGVVVGSITIAVSVLFALTGCFGDKWNGLFSMGGAIDYSDPAYDDEYGMLNPTFVRPVGNLLSKRS